MPIETVSTFYEDGDPTGWDHYFYGDEPSADPPLHRSRDVAAGLFLTTCDGCARMFESATEAIRVHDRMALESLVQCSHEAHCSRRDEDHLIFASDAYLCPECGDYFCLAHHHERPNVPSAYCSGCDNRFARCVDLEFCEDHNAYWCERHEHAFTCAFDGDGEFETGGYRGPLREPHLTFEDDGDHPLAMGKRFAAVEIEVENGGNFSLPDKFGIHEDGSLSDGVEVVLPPARGVALVHNLKLAMETLSDAGWDGSSGNCSMHTHIDLRDRRDDKVFQSRLFATFYAVEDVLFAMQDRHREFNNYCIPMRDGWTFYAAYGKWAPDFDYVFNKRPKTPQGKEYIDSIANQHHGNRYNAFNFHSIPYRGTLEVRIHEGCLDYETAALWIELLQFIIARVERGVSYKQLRRLLELDVASEKIALMARFFSLPDVVVASIKARMRQPFSMSYELGEAIKGGRNPDPTKMRTVARLATLFQCAYCESLVALDDPVRAHRPWPNNLSGYGHINACTRPSYIADRDILWADGVRLGRATDIAAREPARSRAGRQARALMRGETPVATLTPPAHQLDLASLDPTSPDRVSFFNNRPIYRASLDGVGRGAIVGVIEGTITSDVNPAREGDPF